ncbi:hypothetical protein [Bacillus cereus]
MTKKEINIRTFVPLREVNYCIGLSIVQSISKVSMSLLVFKENHPFLPLTDYYHECLGRIDKSSAISYLNCLLPFFKWLEKESNYQGKKVQWNDSEEQIRVVVEDYLMHEMKCKIRDKDTFRFINLTSKSPNTISRFLSALKSFYKAMIRLKQYPYSNPIHRWSNSLTQL